MRLYVNLEFIVCDMAIDSLIPRRPQCIESKLTVLEKNCIEYAVAFSAKNEEAFLLFHPEYITSDGKLSNEGKRRCKDFFSYSKNKEYRDAYTAYLKEFLNDDKGKSEAHLIEVDESRKDKALKSLLNQAMSMVESGDTLDPDTLKVLAEIFKKLGILKDEVEVQESPRRYIPLRCSECDYRSFVESYVETGQIENSCLRCKALDLAKEHGFRYDPKNLLRPTDEKTAE